MADAGSDAIYTGFWRDYDRGGRLRGSTLTLTNEKAAALLAFLAIVVTFAANRSFKIFRFCLHHFIHPADDQSDAVTAAKRRRQVILRNSETAGGALVSLLDTTISERSGAPVSVRAISKSVLLKLLITAHWLVFIALSILTSQTVIGKTVVSKRTDTCGKWVIPELPASDESPDTMEEWLSALNQLWYNETLDADNYVHNCYDDKSSRWFFDCTKFASRSLSFAEEDNVLCPFEHGFCFKGENSAFAMDSGNISFSALGINKKHSKDLSVRRRTTCALVDPHPFIVSLETSEEEGNLTTVEYSFGTSSSGGNDSVFYVNEGYTETYNLQEYLYVNNTAHKVLQPNKTTNDVTVLLLRGPNVYFNDAQDDPWFTAHRAVSFDNSTGLLKPGYARYTMDNFLNVLVCDERIHFCNHITGQCTQWRGLIDGAESLVTTVGDQLVTEDLEGAVDMFISIVMVSTCMDTSYIYNSIQGRGHAALQAIKYYNLGTQYRLDPEQWKVELRYWFKMALARAQLAIFNTIEKSIHVDAEKSRNLWADDDDISNEFCGCIKFRSASHTSLSTIGIMVILLCTLGLTLISFLDQLIASRFLRGRFQHFISAWEETENLALLKRTMNEVSIEVFFFISFHFISFLLSCQP